MAIEMTIVMPPLVVDFASASLDVSIEFSEEIWGRLGAHKAGTIWLTMGDGSGDLDRTRPHARSLTEQYSV
jgi:hypothetical protein